MKQLTALFIFSFACLAQSLFADFDPETSVVEIEVTKKVYDYRTPWITRNDQVRKNGILIEDKQILTTADGLSGQYLCRIKKGGISRQYVAELVWVDYYANVAIFNVDEADFWEGMKPVTLTKAIPQGGELQIFRWRAGRIEERTAEVVRLSSGRSKLSYVRHLVLTVASTIQSAGWSEPVFDDGRLIGLTAAAGKDSLTILPSKFISKVIERHSSGDGAAGLGYFDFKSMRAKNPALLASKGLDLRDVGVVVTEVGGKGLTTQGLQVGDVILEVDGFEIDSEGKYLDPDYGRLSMSSLATRAHSAGEIVPFKVWRDGREQMVDYNLPSADFDKGIIPEQRYDAAPKYLIAGGLLFQPLDGPLLQALGQNKPVLLDYYSQQTDIDGRTGFVVLSGVMPDNYNLGYESLRYLLLDQINGQTVNNLDDVVAALEAPQGGFHRIRFMPDERMLNIVLDAESMDAATAKILQTYRVPKASQL
ncbi:MAG: PDZ domain-containing protein [Opitutales bacterium]